MENTQPQALPVERASFVSNRNTIFPVRDDLNGANEGKIDGRMKRGNTVERYAVKY